jgi:hypothetical protein
MIIIIGAGRVGGALAARARANGTPCTLVDRARGWETLQDPAGDPIVLAVRNDDLDAVVGRVPQHRRADLVLVQNGMLRDWLAAHGLQAATRGLLFFAVPRRGAPIELGPANPFWGPHAARMARWFELLGLPAKVLDASDFATAELEKLLWNSCFGTAALVSCANTSKPTSARSFASTPTRSRHSCSSCSRSRNRPSISRCDRPTAERCWSACAATPGRSRTTAPPSKNGRGVTDGF